MEQIVDTNFILRYLVGDNKRQQLEARRSFQKAAKGKSKLLIKSLVIAESCFVLESFYKKNRKDIADSFEVFLSQRWLRVEDRNTMLLLWQWYKKGFHFVDSFLLAWAKVNEGRILSFDKKLLTSSK